MAHTHTERERERERDGRPEAESAGHLSAVLKHVLGFGLSSGWSWGNEGRVYSFKANVTNEVDWGSGRLSESERERERVYHLAAAQYALSPRH